MLTLISSGAPAAGSEATAGAVCSGLGPNGRLLSGRLAPGLGLTSARPIFQKDMAMAIVIGKS